MGNIINFMEKLGASAEFQELSEAEVIEMLKSEQLTSDSVTDIGSFVDRQLDVRKNFVCGIIPAEEPAEPGDDEPEDDQPEEK